MSYLAATVLDSYRAEYALSNLDKFEHRISQYGCLDAFMTDTPNLIPTAQIEAGRTASSRATTIPVIKKTAFTPTTTRKCAAWTKPAVSAFVTPSWTTIVDGFTMVPGQYVNNFISYEADFRKKLLDLQIAFLTSLDTAAYTYLNTYMAQVNAADGNPYTVASYISGVPAADANNFLNELDAVMGQNDLTGPFNIAASPRFAGLVNFLGAQGSGNATNTAYQIPGKKFHYSNRCTVAASDRDTVFVMPEGSLAFMSWINPQNRSGYTAGAERWGTIPLPLLGIEAELYFQAACGENSTETGAADQATPVESFGISFDYSFLHAYNQDIATYAGTIYKFGLSKT
jgi:hypothetical protein